MRQVIVSDRSGLAIALREVRSNAKDVYWSSNDRRWLLSRLANDRSLRGAGNQSSELAGHPSLDDLLAAVAADGGCLQPRF